MGVSQPPTISALSHEVPPSNDVGNKEHAKLEEAILDGPPSATFPGPKMHRSPVRNFSTLAVLIPQRK